MLMLLLSLASANPTDDAIARSAGHAVAVVVAKGSWCPVCIAELKRLEARSDEIAATGGEVIGLFAEAPEVVRAAGDQNGLTMQLLSDDGRWLSEHDFTRSGLSHPLPGVLFYDTCGEPVLRLDGRSPGAIQTDAILETLRRLQAAPCKGPTQT